MHASSRLANCLLRYTNIPTKGGNAKIVAYRYCLPGKYCLMTEHSRRLYNKLFTYTTRTAIKVHVHVDTPLKVILKKRSQLTALPPPTKPSNFSIQKARWWPGDRSWSKARTVVWQGTTHISHWFLRSRERLNVAGQHCLSMPECTGSAAYPHSGSGTQYSGLVRQRDIRIHSESTSAHYTSCEAYHICKPCPFWRERKGHLFVSLQGTWLAHEITWFRLFIISGKCSLPHDCPFRPSRPYLHPNPSCFFWKVCGYKTNQQAINNRTLASVCYTVFIPALTQP